MHVDLTGLPPVFLTSEAAAEGLDSRRLKVAAANEALLRLGRGVFADPGRWPSDPVERHVLLATAAVRAVDECALSHVSAAVRCSCRTPVAGFPGRQ